MSRFFIILLFLYFQITTHSQESVLPDKYIEEVLPYDFENPVGLEFDQMGRTYIWEKAGKIKVINESGILQETPLLDITEEVAPFGDHGLIGFALHPNFHINGFCYVYYVVDRHYMLHYEGSDYDVNTTIENQSTIGRLTRYKVDFKENTVVDRESRKILIGETWNDGLPILMTSHGVGSVVFGQDGSLLLSFGDGGSFTQADLGNANDTYHEQAIEDGAITEEQNVGSYRGMMKTTPHGKVLRIDPLTGHGIPSNPYYNIDRPNDHESKIWALGFRNPYKFIHIENTGSHNVDDGDPGVFVVGDVGSSFWEELSIIDKGGDWYGWPFFEGYGGRLEYWDSNMSNPEAPSDDCDAGYFPFRRLVQDENEKGEYTFENPCGSGNIPDDVTTLYHRRPIIAYSNDVWNPPAKTHIGSFDNKRTASSISIQAEDSRVVGSLVEGGSVIPGGINTFSSFEGFEDYLFVGDFHGYIYAIELDQTYAVTKVEPFLTTNKGITDLKFSPFDESLYYINIIDQKIKRISYGGTAAPTAIIKVDRQYGASPLSVQFDATQSIDRSDSGLTYFWDFGDGTTSTETNPTHVYQGSATEGYDVTLTVSDGAGKVSIAKKVISLNNTPPVATITSITDNQTYATNDYNVVPLIASVMDGEHDQGVLSYEWRVDLHHDTHFHPGTIDRRSETMTIIDPLGCGVESYWYTIYLTVTDPAGLSGMDTVSLYPYCGPAIARYLTLEGSVEDDDIKLSWVTDRHEAVAFEVEKTDDVLFRKIGELNANDLGSAFSFVDVNPYIGDNYYRIKAINRSGDYTYSDPVNVKYNNENLQYSITPNPTFGDIELSISNIGNADIEIEMYDFTGRLVLQESWEKLDGDTSHKINFARFSPGIYMYNVMINNQSNIGKLMKY